MTKKHALIMLACCLIPLVALAAIFVFKIPVTGLLYFGLLLLCPALHLLMMRNMMGHSAGREAAGSHVGHHPVDRPAPRLLNPAPASSEGASRDAANPDVSAPEPE